MVVIQTEMLAYIKYILYCTWFNTYPQNDLVTTNTLIIYIYIWVGFFV